MEEFLFDDGDPDKQIKAFRIKFACGFQIIALPSRPRSLRGMQGFVIIDEAAFHEDLKELMKAAIALLIWGGRVLVISTHNGEDNYFNQLVKEARAGNGYGYRAVRLRRRAEGRALQARLHPHAAGMVVPRAKPPGAPASSRIMATPPTRSCSASPAKARASSSRRR